MINPVKVAIIGCSHGHARNYFGLRNDPLFELVAVTISPGYEDKKYMKALDGIPRYKTDAELYDNHPELEAVVLASENINHIYQVREAVKHGLHIFSMKVPSYDLEEYQEMIELVEKAGVINQVELEMRYHGPMYRVKELIEDGAIGELLSINMLNYSHNPVSAFPWMCDPEASYGKRVPLRPGEKRFRGGGLADHPHIFDAARFLTGADYNSVFAEISPEVRKDSKIEEMIRVIGRMNNGVIFSLDPSYANNEKPDPEWADHIKWPRCVEVFMTAVGTKGTLVVDLFGKTYCYQEVKSETFVCSPGLSSTGLWNRMMNEFYHAIREGKEPAVTLRKHYNSIQAMVAAYDSIYYGEPVQIKYGGDL